MVACGAIGMSGGGMTPRPRGGGGGPLVVATKSDLPTPSENNATGFVQDERRTYQYVAEVNTSTGTEAIGRWIWAEVAAQINPTTGLVESASGKPCMYRNSETLADILGAARDFVDLSGIDASLTDNPGGGILFSYGGTGGSGSRTHAPVLEFTPAAIPAAFALVMRWKQLTGTTAASGFRSCDMIIFDGARLNRVGNSVNNVLNRNGVLTGTSSAGTGAIDADENTLLHYVSMNGTIANTATLTGSGFPTVNGGICATTYIAQGSTSSGPLVRWNISDYTAKGASTMVLYEAFLFNLAP